MCSKLTVKATDVVRYVFTVKFEYIWHFSRVFLLIWICQRQMDDVKDEWNALLP